MATGFAKDAKEELGETMQLLLSMTTQALAAGLIRLRRTNQNSNTGKSLTNCSFA